MSGSLLIVAVFAVSVLLVDSHGDSSLNVVSILATFALQFQLRYLLPLAVPAILISLRNPFPCPHRRGVRGDGTLYLPFALGGSTVETITIVRAGEAE